MYNINCYNWNSIIPKQYVWEPTCGYHAIRNGAMLYKILIQIPNFINKKNYINRIVNNIEFPKFISDTYMSDQVNKYKKNILIRGDINTKQLEKLIEINHKNYPIEVLYNINELSLKLEKNDIRCIIFYRKWLHFNKHWFPIIIHKLDKEINIHIADSFESTWFGEKIIEEILNSIRRDNNIKLNIKCKDERVAQFIDMTINKLFYTIIITIFLFLLVYSTYHN